MDVQKLAAGLWRWTVGYPPVGSVYCEWPAQTVLIDPRLPDDEQELHRFWTALDRDLTRTGGRLDLLLSHRERRLDADRVQRRYSRQQIVDIHDSLEPATVAGVERYEIDGLDDHEAAFLLVGHRALVFADAVVGAGDGRVRLAAGASERLRSSLRRLLALQPRMLLVSCGEPILTAGSAALAEALGSG